MEDLIIIFPLVLILYLGVMALFAYLFHQEELEEARAAAQWSSVHQIISVPRVPTPQPTLARQREIDPVNFPPWASTPRVSIHEAPQLPPGREFTNVKQLIRQRFNPCVNKSRMK
jgi:hypothetical protein